MTAVVRARIAAKTFMVGRKGFCVTCKRLVDVLGREAVVVGGGR
jgi:hypothetical protein